MTTQMGVRPPLMVKISREQSECLLAMLADLQDRVHREIGMSLVFRTHRENQIELMRDLILHQVRPVPAAQSENID